MQHSNLGASSSKRWMNCTASPSLIDTLDPDLRDGSSIYAEEGSAAHCLAELVVDEIARNIDAGLDPSDNVMEAQIVGTVLRKDDRTGEYAATVNPWTGRPYRGSTARSEYEFVADEEMQECVRFYAETILGYVDQCIGPPWVQSETRMYPVPGDPSIFGTTDCVVSDQVGGTIWVVDMKYGKGVKVTAPNNSQAMFYALGAVEEGEYGDQDIVNVVIIQPRVTFADGRRISDWRTTAGELRQWRAEALVPAIQATRSPALAKYQAGDWCRFCPAVALCPLMQEQAIRKAQEAFADDLDALPMEDAATVSLILPSADDPEAIAEALKVSAVLENWIERVRKLADTKILKHRVPVPGFKIVRKRTRRRWDNERDLIAELEEIGQLENATKIVPLTPSQMSKAGFDDEWISARSSKPQGGLEVVHETDSRNQVEEAESAFDIVELDTP